MARQLCSPKVSPFTTIAAIASLLLSALGTGLSQSPSVKVYSMENGLPAGAGFPLLIDSKGILWVGMFEGVCAFDGATFTSYGRSENFSGGALVATEDSGGTLWFGGRTGLTRATRPARFPLALDFHPVAFKGQRLGPVVALIRDQSGTVFAATQTGVYKAHGDTLSDVRLIVPPPSRSAQTVELAGASLLHPENENLVEMTVDRRDVFWLATTRSLLRGRRATPDTGGTTLFFQRPVDAPRDVSLTPFSNLRADDLNRIWYLTWDNKLMSLRYPGRPAQLPPASIGNEKIYEFNIAPDNSVWISSSETIEHVVVSKTDSSAPEILSTQRLTEANGLPKYGWGVNYVFDSSSNLWCYKGPAGLLRISLKGFVSYGASDLHLNAVDNWISLDDGRTIFSGTGLTSATLSSRDNGDLPYRIENQRVEFASPREISVYGRPDGITDTLLLVSSDAIACLVPGKGQPMKIHRLNVVYRDPTSPRLKSPLEIVTAMIDRSGMVWIAEKGLFCGRILGESLLIVHHYSTKDGLSDNTTKVMTQTHDGALWLGGFSDGLSRFDGKSFATFTTASGLNGNAIRALYESDDSTLWIGTRYDGVCAYRAGRFFPYPDFQHLGSDEIWSLAGDTTGALWVGTGQGIASFTPDRALQRQPEVKHFDRRDGLPPGPVGRVGVDRHGMVGCLLGGRLYIARASRLSPDAAAPALYMKSIEINSREATKKDELLLSHDQNNISFTYEAFDLSGGAPSPCQYLLEGLESQWSEPTVSRKITFGSLQPGRYTFKVRSLQYPRFHAHTDSTRDTGQSRLLAISFVIATPFWRTWWFVLLAIVTSVALVGGALTYRVRHLLAVERLRGRIATDLHDDIGSSLSSIALFGDLAERELKGGSPEVAARLRTIAATSRSLLDAMDDIVWSINPRSDRLEFVILRMQDFAVSLLEAKGMTARISIPEGLSHFKLPMDVRRNVYLIFKEIINNIVKHSGATEVRIEFSERQIRGFPPRHGITISVRDNGKGFDDTSAGKGLGLQNMQKRASRLRADLNVRTSTGGGTEIEFVLPVRSPV